MAISPNDAFTVGQVLTAQECNNFPFGIVGNVQRTAGTLTVTSTLADLTGMSVTFTALANRVYKFTALCTGQKLTSATWAGLFLTRTDNTILASTYATAAVNQYFNLSFSCYLSGFTAGSITLKLRGQVSTDTAGYLADSQAPLQLFVEDMGPI
jgi:hypothetical protein